MRKLLGWFCAAWLAVAVHAQTVTSPKKDASAPAKTPSAAPQKSTAPAKTATQAPAKSSQTAPSKNASAAPDKGAAPAASSAKKGAAPSAAAKSAAPAKTPAKGVPATKKGTTAKAGAKRAAPRTTWRNRQTSPTPDRYRQIQVALAAKGFLSPEAVTGEWGPQSIDALKRFQAAQNLEATGKIDSLSLIALGLGPKREAAAKAGDQPPQSAR